MKYVTNLSNNPYYNLAFEEYLFKNLPDEEEFVFLWINSPAIIVGKNQNTIEEINQKFVEENDIKVVRRVTGGGAVYHDFGNLNFSIIKNTNGKEKIDFSVINIPILKALEKFGIKAELTGRNDLTVDGKKISGIAQSLHKQKVLNHGTILYDTDLSILSQALNVKQDKIESKGVKSVKSRVTNIKPYMKSDIDILEFKETLLKYIFEHLGEPYEEYKLSDEYLNNIDLLYKNKYLTWEWNYGQSPDFNWKNYKRFPTGSIDLRLEIKSSIIHNAKIYGDFFGAKDISELENMLKNLKYDKDEVKNALSGIDITQYLGNITLEDFLELLFE
ncbi:MAG: lipoate--protein ligase [Tissierellales bacterium]|nr:lipoate--protein ligase [Tissierellales bacterium]